MVRYALIILLFCSNSFAQYYNELGEGYYQYKKDEIPDNLTKKHLVPPNEVLYKMPAEEFQALYTKTLNHALTERTIENYSEYARMNEMVSLRGQEFASLQILYAQLNPVNSNEQDRDTREVVIDETIARALYENKSEYGFLYFYSPTCTYCIKQEPVIRAFQERHGWEVERIDITQKPHLAESFNVTVTPSIRMVDRSKNVLPMSNGIMSLPELERRAYRFIRYLKGDTHDLDFSEVLK